MSLSKSHETFNRDYFEDGIKNRISAYENYRWIPERSIREACSIANNFECESILDFGCAKGFLVHALRLLGKEAYGVDISKYAIENCHPSAQEYVSHIATPQDITRSVDMIVAKDVLEHIPYEEIENTLRTLRGKCRKLFAAVPLGNGQSYRIREYEMDITHIIREPEEWWLNLLIRTGFKISFFDYKFHYIKEQWTSAHPHGNAFILAT